MNIKNSLSNITIGVIILIMTFVSSNLNWGKDHWKGILEADAKGYYAYLPAIFIYHDLNFGFFEKIEKEKYYDKNLYYDYTSGSNGKRINKYYCGTALVQLPFFLIAHYSSYLLNFDMDGYTKPYPILISIAALFYLWIGLLFLNLTLKTYHFSERTRAFTLIASVFGTHLFYYSVGELGMSHVYSFAFMNMFIYYLRQYFIFFKRKHLLLLSIILGIIVLIRPINGMILFIIPFVAGNYTNLKNGIKKIMNYKKQSLFAFIVFTLIISIQFIIYKISTDQYLVYSYGDEGFNFMSPQIFNILFSYKKGLFLYTPILLLSLTGAYFLWKNARFEFYSFFGFFFLITYILSSWWCWYYGGSFSSRVYVEYIAVFMILLGTLIERVNRKWIRNMFISSIIALIVICQIQTYQYRYYLIHWSEMTKEKYWDVFMKIEKE